MELTDTPRRAATKAGRLAGIVLVAVSAVATGLHWYFCPVPLSEPPGTGRRPTMWNTIAVRPKQTIPQPFSISWPLFQTADLGPTARPSAHLRQPRWCHRPGNRGILVFRPGRGSASWWWQRRFCMPETSICPHGLSAIQMQAAGQDTVTFIPCGVSRRRFSGYRPRFIPLTDSRYYYRKDARSDRSCVLLYLAPKCISQIID